MIKTYNHIFNKPIICSNGLKAYPIKVKDYLFFMQNSYFLQLTENHFSKKNQQQINFFNCISNKYYESMINIFELVFKIPFEWDSDAKCFFSSNLENKIQDVSLAIKHLFNYIKLNINEINKQEFLLLNYLQTKKNILLSLKDKTYQLPLKFYIHQRNYKEIEEIICSQNIIFKKKKYKYKLTKKWADMVDKTKNKENGTVTFEDLISVVKQNMKCSYDDIMNLTIYQLYMDYYRIIKVDNYKTNIILLPHKSKQNKILHYTSQIDLLNKPKDDHFVEQTAFKNLNKAFNK